MAAFSLNVVDVADVIERQKVGAGQCVVVLLCALLMFLVRSDRRRRPWRRSACRLQAREPVYVRNWADPSQHDLYAGRLCGPLT
jgi:hypothetical protein